MEFTKQHEQDLAEIKALYYELGQRVQEGLEQIERIRRIQSQQPALKAREATSVAESGPAGNAHVLAFVHIPKTAGGTVTSMFAAAYSKRALHKAGNYIMNPEAAMTKVSKRSGAWDGWTRKGGRVSVGHVPYGVYKEHLPPNTRYMTFLREPVDRVLSHYYRHLHQKDPRRRTRREPPKQWSPEQGGRIKADSIEQALLEMRLPQISNLATRFLCGHPASLGELPASALDDAKANLREFEFIGIQERFEESLVLLQRMLDLDLIPYEDRHVSSDRPSVEEIPDEQRALIAEHNALDAELYRFGRELFDDTVAAVADPDFEADLETLRARPRTLAPTARELRAERKKVEAGS